MQHSGSKGCASIKPLGLGRPSLLTAAFQRRPAASPCCSKPTEGRCVRARWPAGGESHRLATFGGEEVISGPYHCTHLHCRRADADDRSIGSRMAADLHRKVAPSTVLPVTACDRCELRLCSRSAQAQDLPRLQRARGWPRRPPSRDPKTRKSTFHFCVRERVKV